MIVRKANKSDIKGIVNVLKASLGEEKLALSEEIYNFKHLENPFGESIVLIAEENDQIAGVRAFMRWKWQSGEKIFSALRAVDTATHPKFQGKGIFKKLTLKAVEIARDSGDHLIFNTPNNQSRPGYLKMGWEAVDKVLVGLRPSTSFIFSKKVDQNYESEIQASDSEIENLCKSWNKRLSIQKKIFTTKNREFLRWRYENNPLQEYEVFANEKLYVAGYIKNRSKFKEFRISECIYVENLEYKELKNVIKNLNKKFGSHLVTYSPQLLPLKGKKGKFGPLLTLNDLNLTAQENVYFSNIDYWNNSLGDLELF